MTQAQTLSRWKNLLVAVAAITLSVAIFFGFQAQGNSTSLAAQSAQALPLSEALQNGKPTLTEFYADWCTSCQAMAGMMAELKKHYQGRVNFVMLNVDNSKWLPEIFRYQVDGIPHFVFFDAQGGAIAQSIGEQPNPIMAANLEALVNHAPLPYAPTAGQTSDFLAPVSATPQSDPRSHSALSK